MGTSNNVLKENYRFVLLIKAGHISNVEQPEQVTSNLLKFLAQL